MDTSTIKEDTALSKILNEITFTSVEIQAAFPGGDEGWVEFLTKNLRTNVPGKHHAPAGKYTVKVLFVVDREGNVSDITTPVDPGYGTAQEVIRVMKKSPRWTPGYQNGKAVKSYRAQNITFQIDNE